MQRLIALLLGFSGAGLIFTALYFLAEKFGIVTELWCYLAGLLLLAIGSALLKE